MSVVGRRPPSRWSCSKTLGARRMVSRVGVVVVIILAFVAGQGATIALTRLGERYGTFHWSRGQHWFGHLPSHFAEECLLVVQRFLTWRHHGQYSQSCRLPHWGQTGVERRRTLDRSLTLREEFGLLTPDLREPTSGLEPLTCPLRVRSHTFTAVSRRFGSRLRKPFVPVLRFRMFPDVRSGYCLGYSQSARLG